MKRFLSLAAAVAATNVGAAELPMEHVLVTVPLHKKTAETALPITALSGDDLRRAAASTLGDTLSNTPGLANASFGPGVGQPVIRGQQGARVTVLQNGTSSADASALSADHAVGVEPMLAESIEILRGPSTLLYGGGAIGGVVNIVDNRIPTATIESATGGLEYRHDSASDMDTAVFLAEAGSSGWAFHVDGLYRDWNDVKISGDAAREDNDHDEGHEDQTTHGYINNTAGRTKSLTLGSSYHFNSGFLGLAVNLLENTYGIPAGAHEEHQDSVIISDYGLAAEAPGLYPELEAEQEHGDITLDVEQTRYDAALHWHEPLHAIEVFRAFLTFTDYQHDELEGDGELGTRYNNETWEVRVEAVHQPVGGFHGVLGVQALAGEFSALGEEAFVPVTDSRELGIFLLEDYHAGDWTFEGGMRFDWDKRDPDSIAAEKQDFNSLSVSGSALWDFAPSWQAGLSLSRAERAPATEELYSNVGAHDPSDYIVHAATSSIELGNQQLDTEVSNNADLTLSWQGDERRIAITFFYNDFSDYINLMNTGLEVDETPVLRYVQEDAQFHGAEFDSEFRLADFAGGELRLGLFGDSIRGELDGGAAVPRLPPRRVGSSLSWSGERLELWGRVVDAAGQDRPGDNEDSTPGYTRWDLGADYRVPLGASELLLFAKLNNASDEEIRLSTSFLRDVAPEAGRSIEAGLRLTF